MCAVFLDDAEGEDADALGLVDGLNEVRSGELFPLCVDRVDCAEDTVDAARKRIREARARRS